MKNESDCDSPDVEVLYDAIESATDDERYAKDEQLHSRIILALLNEASSNFDNLLDEELRRALDSTRMYLDGLITDQDRLVFVNLVWNRLDRLMKTFPPDTPEELICRLVAGSLLPNEGFSYDAATHLTGSALIVGVSPQQIAEVYERYLPNFRNPFPQSS